MDIQSIIDSYLDSEGRISLEHDMSLVALAERIFNEQVASGEDDRIALTYWDYSESREGLARRLTRREVNTRVKAIAVRLAQITKQGDPVALLMGNSPEYVLGFLGAIYAGCVPVPLYDPREPGHAEHLAAVIGDARPGVVLTNRASAPAVRALFAHAAGPERPRIVALDALPDSLAAGWRAPQLEDPLDAMAFLQYTSGSTRTPSGVMITHRSIVTNILEIFRATWSASSVRLVSWAPMHHDMGLVLDIYALVIGAELETMTPQSFVQQPARWVRQLSSDPGSQTHIYTVAPNFALELAARVATPDKIGKLDLSLVDGVFIGGEPVTARTIDIFAEAFGSSGLRRDAIRPSYGLAEACLSVSVSQRPRVLSVDREAFAAGRIEEANDGALLVSCGVNHSTQGLIVVDLETHDEVPEGIIGELWNQGGNLAAGYFGKEEETQATFANTLGQRLKEGSEAEGFPDDGWLATGDLGAIVDGEVYVTGRLKELIVIAGRNHYPQDIERSVRQATDHVDPMAIAAFSIPGDDTEELVVLCERAEGRTADGDRKAAERITASVGANHGVTPRDIVFLDAGEIPRSSAAKIARRVARARYLTTRG